jgi:hypothetical protein
MFSIDGWYKILFMELFVIKIWTKKAKMLCVIETNFIFHTIVII